MSPSDAHAIVQRLAAEGLKLLRAPREQVRRFTGDPVADALLNDLERYPHAFVLACVMDRQMNAGRAWMIPHLISEKVGGFDFPRLNDLTQDQLKAWMIGPPALHRFPSEMARNFLEAVKRIGDTYHGHASRLWADCPRSEDVVNRFAKFRGVGPKIAHMAANILAREFKVPFSDYGSIEVAADVHVCRVFGRLGLVEPQAAPPQVVAVARSLHPQPGLLDYPAFEIGYKWCRPDQPLCRECFMNDICPTACGSRPSGPSWHGHPCP
jgi:endonuclease III